MHPSIHSSSCFVTVLTLLGSIVGCGGGGSPPPPAATPGEARAILEEALTAWKERKQPSEVRSTPQAFLVRDYDWEAGRELVRYKLKDDGATFGHDVRFEVEMVIKNAQGSTEDKTIRYSVGTQPVPTVFRGDDES